MFFLHEARYRLNYYVSEAAAVLVVWNFYQVATTRNTQLDGYGILALIQVLTNTVLSTESIMQRGTALTTPKEANNTWPD